MMTMLFLKPFARRVGLLAVVNKKSRVRRAYKATGHVRFFDALVKFGQRTESQRRFTKEVSGLIWVSYGWSRSWQTEKMQP